MNTDKLTTWLGVAQAIGVELITYISTAKADGSFGFDSPLFYIGGAVAILMGVKAYFTKGVDGKTSTIAAPAMVIAPEVK